MKNFHLGCGSIGIVYCSTECGNTKCERNSIYAQKNITCAWVKFFEHAGCDIFKPKLSIAELLESVNNIDDTIKSRKE